MPRRSHAPCTHIPGDQGDPHRCPEATSHKSGLCAKHLRMRRAAVDAARPTSATRGYGRAHRASRAQATRRGQVCAHAGCTVTDGLHREHRDGDARNNHATNIQYLCASHHGSKTLRDDVDRDERGRILPRER